MSFIFDALKKSESERQRQADPTLLESRVAPAQRRLPAWAVVLGALLVVNVLVVGFLALRDKPASAPAIAGPAPAAPAVTTPVAAAPAAPSQAAASTPVPASPPVPAASAPAAMVDAGAAENPADLEPAVAPAPTSPTAERASPVQTYAELSGQLPPLRLDLHVYGSTPGERYAFINMHKVHEGDTTPEGLRVLQITHDGVVLDYRGTEFLLGRE